jgi:hypothetical protein
VTPLDGRGNGGPRFLLFRKQLPKPDNVLVVASDEVSIGDGDYGIDTGFGVWFHFREMTPFWHSLQTQESQHKAYT